MLVADLMKRWLHSGCSDGVAACFCSVVMVLRRGVVLVVGLGDRLVANAFVIGFTSPFASRHS